METALSPFTWWAVLIFNPLNLLPALPRWRTAAFWTVATVWTGQRPLLCRYPALRLCPASQTLRPPVSTSDHLTRNSAAGHCNWPETLNNWTSLIHLNNTCKLNKHAPTCFFFVSVEICNIFSLFLCCWEKVSLCCVSSSWYHNESFVYNDAVKRADFSRCSWWCRHAFRYSLRSGVDTETATVWMLLLGVSIVTQLSPREGLCFTLRAVKGHQTVVETIRNCEWHFPSFWAKLFPCISESTRKSETKGGCWRVCVMNVQTQKCRGSSLWSSIQMQ